MTRQHVLRHRGSFGARHKSETTYLILPRKLVQYLSLHVFMNRLEEYCPGMTELYLILPWVRGCITQPLQPCFLLFGLVSVFAPESSKRALDSLHAQEHQEFVYIYPMMSNHRQVFIWINDVNISDANWLKNSSRMLSWSVLFNFTVNKCFQKRVYAGLERACKRALLKFCDLVNCWELHCCLHAHSGEAGK